MRIARSASAVAFVSLLLAAPAIRPARAQAPLAAADEAGRARGHLDGSRLGEDQGQQQGRAQVLVDEFVRGFSRGVHEIVDESVTDEAWAAGRERSWDAGHAEGLELGRRRGREAARREYARLTGKPSFRPEVTPAIEVPPPPEDRRACPAAEAIELEPSLRLSVRLDPTDLERRGSPLGFAIPAPRVPSRSWMADAARAEGFTLPEQVDAWVRSYERAFERGYEQGYERVMDDVSYSMRSKYADDGRLAGEREAERRAKCDAHERGHVEGYRAGFDEGFEAGFEEGWRETASFHDTHAVVMLEDVTLEDASGDGVIEPGEELRARVSLANAGLVDSGPAPLRWRGVQGLDADGKLTGRLPAMERRSEVAVLGAVDRLALFQSTLVVRFEPEGDDATEIKGRVGRPVELTAADAALEARDGQAVAVVRARLLSVAREDTDRGLGLESGESAVDVGVVRAGETRTVELVVPVEPATAVLGTASGTVVLKEAAGAAWMQRDWIARLSMSEAVALTGKLAEPERAVGALSRRLRAEYEAALAEPKLYGRLESRSELSQYARARLLVPPEVRRLLDDQVTAPLVRDAQGKDVPRRVRKAVKEAFGLR